MSFVLSEDNRVDDPGRSMEKGGESDSETDIDKQSSKGSPVLSHSQKSKKRSKRLNLTDARDIGTNTDTEFTDTEFTDTPADPSVRGETVFAAVN